MSLNNKLPDAVKSVLWSYDIDGLDLEINCQLIVAQVLNFGTTEATEWLFDTYTLVVIKRVAQQIPKGQWDKKSLNYWSMCLGISPAEKAVNVMNALPIF